MKTDLPFGESEVITLEGQKRLQHTKEFNINFHFY
ncbi:MAG: hypothetical protein RL264_1279 [Bacteroidota bacterium]|jgi:hypothetical protein